MLLHVPFLDPRHHLPSPLGLLTPQILPLGCLCVCIVNTNIEWN